MGEKKKKFIKVLIVGICMILSAIAGYLADKFDGDPNTVPDATEAVKEVKKGVEMIKDAKDEADNSDPEGTD